MKKSFFLILLIFINIKTSEINDITRGIYTNNGINIGQSMNNAGSSYYPNNMVTQVFFQGNIKQADLKSNSTMYKISLPGRYYIASDLLFNQTSNNAIGIEIAASNVILDLNSKTLTHDSSSGAYTGFKLIQINQGTSNVTITNGTLVSDNVTTSTGPIAIYLQKDTVSSANKLELSNLSVSKFTGGGIIENPTVQFQSNGLTISNVTISEINGNTSPNSSCLPLYIRKRSNITLQNSTFNNNTQTNNFSFYITGFILCSNIKVSNCDTSYNNSLGSSGQLSTWYFFSCNNVELSYCNTSTNYSAGITSSSIQGYYFWGCSDAIVNCCAARNLEGNGGCNGFTTITSHGAKINSCRSASLKGNSEANGFNNTNSSGVEFSKCEAINLSSSGKVYGFNNIGSSNCTYSECKAKYNLASGNSSNSIPVISGFKSGTSSSTNNKFENCIALSNISAAASQTGSGFYFTQEKNSIINNCESIGNGYPDGFAFGLGAGIIFDTYGAVCTNFIVSNNKLFNNYGAQQYGFVDWANPTSTILIKNTSLGQGQITDALSSDGKSIINSQGTSAYKHNYLLRFGTEQITSSIKETFRENMDALSTIDDYHNISIF